MKPREDEVERLAHRRHHELRDMTAVAGFLIAVAVVGGFAGIAWALVGGLLGGAIGFVAGVALEEDAQRAAARDRELDAEIGVSTPDLGAADIAAASLSRLEAEHGPLQANAA